MRPLSDISWGKALRLLLQHRTKIVALGQRNPGRRW
jgi:hypothetical protein